MLRRKNDMLEEIIGKKDNDIFAITDACVFIKDFWSVTIASCPI